MTDDYRTQTVQILAWPAAVVSVLLLLLALWFLFVAATGDDELAFLGFYYAGVLAMFEVPAVALAAVALRRAKIHPGRGQVLAAVAWLPAFAPMLLWALLGGSN